MLFRSIYSIRKKEIGTYYCLGVEKTYLIWMYSLEIFFVNIVACTTGILFGLVIRIIINGLNIPITDTGLQLAFAGDRIYVGASFSTVAWIFCGVALISCSTALTTLGKSLKVSPSVAIRETEG